MGKLTGIKKFQTIAWSHIIGNRMCRNGFIPEPPPAGVAAVTVPIIKVIKSDGIVMMYDQPINVSSLMFEFPKHMVCNSDSLYIGKKISALSEDDQLQLGNNYFLLPIHFFQSALTFATVTSFAAASKVNYTKMPSLSNCQLFEIQKTVSGLLRIHVRDEFISRLVSEAAKEDENTKKMMMMFVDKNITNSKKENCEFDKDDDDDDEGNPRRVCTTPELQKEYKQLVLVGRSSPWKPKLDMIRESDKKSSNRKRVAVLFISASFRVKKRNNNNNNNRSATPENNKSTTTHKMTKKKKKKKSLSRRSSDPQPPSDHHRHHEPIPNTCDAIKSPSHAVKHKSMQKFIRNWSFS